jgi:hypothetical protein
MGKTSLYAIWTHLLLGSSPEDVASGFQKATCMSHSSRFQVFGFCEGSSGTRGFVTRGSTSRLVCTTATDPTAFSNAWLSRTTNLSQFLDSYVLRELLASPYSTRYLQDTRPRKQREASYCSKCRAYTPIGNM